MRKIITGLLIASASLALAACNKPAQEAAPVVTEDVPIETPAVDEATAPAQGTTAKADEKGSDERGTDERGTDERGTDERGTDERGTDERGTDERGTDER